MDVLSAAQLHICLKKVRFLLFTEEEFQRDVLPSGVFPLNEARVMSEIIRHAPGSENATLSLIHDRQLQQTRRPMMLKSVVVTKELQWDQAEYLYYKLSHIREIRPLGYFTVDKHILLRRIRSVSFLNEEAGTLKLQENGGFKIDRPWKHGSCTFEKPIPLHPNISYHLAYESDNWRAEVTNFRVNLEQCVGGVWFKGMFFCSHFLLEFSRFYTADLETTDKVWASMRPVEDETLMKNYKAIRSIFSRMFNYGPSTSRGLRRTREGQISEASGAELGANNSSNAEGDSDNGAASDGRAASPVTGNPDVDTNATDEVLSSVVLQLAEGTEEEMEELPS